MATELRSFYTPSTAAHAAPHSSPIVDELINKYSSSMSTSYRAATSHVKSRNLIQRWTDRIRLLYYRYEVTFGVYVMTPGEKFVANTFVFVCLSLLIWACLFYFPQLLFQKLGRTVWLLTGHCEDSTAFSGIFEQSYSSPSVALAIPANSMAY